MTAVTAKQKREYDRFGPWVTEVQTEIDVPDAFLPYYTPDEMTELAFKIPHPIERRNAKPGDNLYDYLIVLKKGEMNVLKLSGDTVQQFSVSYGDVTALTTLYNLLYGELMINYDGGTFSFPFNTVSENLLEEAVQVIETRAAVTSKRELQRESVEPALMNHLFRGLYRKESLRNESHLLAYQQSMLLEKVEKSRLDRFFDRLKRVALRPVMFLLSNSYFVVFHSVPQLVRWSRGHYGYARTSIPLDRLKSISFEESQYVDCLTMNIAVEGHTFSLEVDTSIAADTLISAVTR